MPALFGRRRWNERRAWGVWLALALLLPACGGGGSAVSAQAAQACPPPTALTAGFTGAMKHVRYLADDALEGRDAGSPGGRCAAEYIARSFEALGLEGAGPGGSFFQPFQARMGSFVGAESALRIGQESFATRRDWLPFGFSAPGSVRAPLIYGGPGVSRPGTEEDAYARLDLTGKIVVLEGSDPHGGGAGSLTGDPHFKATVAAGRGAAAVLILLPEGVPLPDPEAERRPPVRIPAGGVAGSVAARVREAAQAGLEGELVAQVDPRMVELNNVAALLRGSEPQWADQVVVLGAHFDHLGLGGQGSLDPDRRAVHNGADDNASGTAALLEAARRLAEDGMRPARSVLFLAFDGEEKGLWGSAHYIKNPFVSLENTVAMINLDMVGRLRENTLTVYGTGTALEWIQVVEKVNGSQPLPFRLSPIPDGFGPSDHSSFYAEGIPVLHFFTNTHSEYHRPDDDWHLIEADGLERVTALVADLLLEMAGSADHPPRELTPVQAPPPAPGGTSPATQEAPSTPGYGAYMGTIPDMTPQPFGVRITGVRENSPAEKAGLRAGDILVELGGTEIADLYAYTYALRSHKPGDEVTVVVLRNGERLTFKARLGVRN